MTKFNEVILDLVETDAVLLDQADRLLQMAALADSPSWWVERYFLVNVPKLRQLIDECEDPEFSYGLDIEYFWKLSEITDRIFTEFALLKGTL